MYTIEGALELVYQNSDSYWYSSDSIYITSLRTSLLGSLFYHLASLLLVMTLVELGNGFIFCLTETRTALQKIMRNVAIVSSIFLFIIAIASFGILNKAYSIYLESSWSDEESSALPSAGKKLSAAFEIILFAWALGLLVFGALVFKEIKHNYVLKNVSCPCFPQKHQHMKYLYALFSILTQPCSPQFSSSSPPYSTSSPVFMASSMWLSLPSLIITGTTRAIRLSCSSILSLPNGSTPQPWRSSSQSLSASATACGPPYSRGWMARSHLRLPPRAWVKAMPFMSDVMRKLLEAMRSRESLQ